MKFLLILLLSGTALAQGVRYDGRVQTVSGNGPSGAQAPVMAIVNATVTICATGTFPCAPLTVYSNQGLTVPASNPMRVDGQGRYGFWLAAGTYYKTEQNAAGDTLGTYPFTLGGSGGSGGGATLPSTPAIVKSVTSTTSTAATAADVVGLFPGTGTCYLRNDGTCAVVTGTAANPAAPAQAVQFAGPGATAFAADPQININNSTHALTAQIVNGIVNSDSIGTAPTAQAAANFTGTLQTPPTSTDTTPLGALPPRSGYQPTAWFDRRAGTNGFASIDPGQNLMMNLNGQAAEPKSWAFTHMGNSLYLGGEQTGVYQQNYWFEGFDNGAVGCPYYCSQSGFIQDPNGNIQVANTVSGATGTTQPTWNVTKGGTTTDGGVTWTNIGAGTNPGRWAATTLIGSQNWQVGLEKDITNYFNGAGIHGLGNDNINCAGIGDCQMGGYDYNTCEGGFVAFSDEGCYASKAVFVTNSKDPIGVITSITDPSHLKIGTFYNGSTAGQGRYLIDTTNLPKDASSTTLQHIPVDSVASPSTSGLGYGTFTMSAANFPVSTQGTLVGDCLVPTQTRGVAQATCTVAITAGTAFTTSLPLVMAADENNDHNFGVQVLSASAVTAGQQTLTLLIHRAMGSNLTVGHTTWIFQGGLAGSMISLDSDGSPDGNIYGSVFPVLGCISSTTCAYANYNSSQVWAGIPNAGSTFQPLAQSNVALDTIVRHSGTVTAYVSNPSNTGTDSIYALPFFTLVGCSDSSVNGYQAAYPQMAVVNGRVQVSFTQAGADTTCPTAMYNNPHARASLFWGAEAYDVVDRTPGLTPAQMLNGTLVTSYQPNFAVGDVARMPPHYAMAIEGARYSLSMSQPSDQNVGVDIHMSNFTALAGTAINISSEPITQLTAGTGGTGGAGSGVTMNGPFSTDFNIMAQPMHQGTVFNIGFPYFGYNNLPYFANSNIFKIDNCDVVNWDDPTKAWTWSDCSQKLPTFQITPTSLTSFQKHYLYDPRFGGLVAGTGAFTASTHLSECGFQNATGTPCYSGIPPAVGPTVTTVGAAGTTGYGYVIVYQSPGGQPITTPYGATSLGNATLSSSNYNSISCSVMPSGATGTVYAYVNYLGGNFVPVGACSSPSSTVVDNSVHSSGQVVGNTILQMAGQFNTGAVLANGAGGFFGFSQQNQFNGTSSPLTIKSQFTSPADGVVELDGATAGDGLGVLKVGQLATVGGTTQGLAALAVGTGTISTANLPTNYVGIIGPASGTPSYLLQLPSTAPSSGTPILSFAAPAVVNGVNQAIGSWVAAGGGGGSIPSVTNVLKGNGSGGAADTGISAANLGLLNATQSWTGINTFSGVVSNTLIANGTLGANQTDSAVVDFAGGLARILGFGPNTSTAGGFATLGVSTDASIIHTYINCTPGAYICTFGQPIAVPEIKTATASNTDLAGEITLSGGTGSYSFTGGYSSRPECFIHDHTTPTATPSFVVTVSTITITGTGTDVIGYGCIARN